MSAGVTRHPSLDELSAWVDGEVGGEVERRVLAEHVAGCPSCASLVEDFRVLAGAQASAVVPPVPRHLAKRVFETLARDGRSARSTGRRFVLPLSAAATVLMGVVALWLLRQQPAPGEPAVLDGGSARDAIAERQAPVPQSKAQEELPSVGTFADKKDAVPAARGEAVGARKNKVIARPEAHREFASVPPPVAPEVPGVPANEEVAAGAIGGIAESDVAGPEQRPAAMGLPGSRWTRRVTSHPVSGLSKERSDAPSAPTQTAPAEADEQSQDAMERLASVSDRESCPTLDVLEPPLLVPGFDAERGRALAERARQAGATSSTLEGAPRLTLLVPARAWPSVRAALAESGIELPAAAATAPPGAVCLIVTLEAPIR